MVKNIDFYMLFGGIYKNKRVFITGHTGFKGSWLALWLTQMGAIVKGYSLAPNTTPSHWELLKLNIDSVYTDIRNREQLMNEIEIFKPDIVFHLAAQPLVRLSYEKPIETYETNVIGTLNLLEACRNTDTVKAIINITTDKCYENKEWVYGYRENDPMGGFDPYSSSKACMEVLTASYRDSYWNLKDYKKKHNTLLASVRAGNVIGGGDWADDRLVPDIMKATSVGKKVQIRNPYATRPWQHVLEPLSGYLMVGQRLLEGKREFAEAWNFGPGDEGNLNVMQVAEYLMQGWSEISIDLDKNTNHPHEANLLKLDCSKAHSKLRWFSVWNNKETCKYTADWYKVFYSNENIITNSNIELYIKTAKEKSLIWIE